MIYHITSRAAWEAAQAAGAYRAESLATEGFIHFSTREQVLGVANAFYRGQSDLVLLVVDSARLTAPLRYEAPSHPTPTGEIPTDQQFPHLYGPLNADAVARAVPFAAGDDGRFALPAGL
jgi:uncharacterized protein (DUF952 family)